MRNNLVASYTHTDREVRFLLRYTFTTAFLAGAIVASFVMACFH